MIRTRVRCRFTNRLAININSSTIKRRTIQRGSNLIITDASSHVRGLSTISDAHHTLNFGRIASARQARRRSRRPANRIHRTTLRHRTGNRTHNASDNSGKNNLSTSRQHSASSRRRLRGSIHRTTSGPLRNRINVTRHRRFTGLNNRLISRPPTGNRNRSHRRRPTTMLRSRQSPNLKDLSRIIRFDIRVRLFLLVPNCPTLGGRTTRESGHRNSVVSTVT